MTTPMTLSEARKLLDLPLSDALDPEQLKAHYRRAARASHPDGQTPDEELFKRVAQARDLLEENMGTNPDVLSLNIPVDRPRQPPVWTRQTATAAGVLRMDDLMDDLRKVIREPVRPLIRHLPGGDVQVSRMPPGGSVLVSLRAVIVLDGAGEPVECDTEMLFDAEAADVRDLYRGR